MHVTLEMALLVESMLDNSTVAITGGILKHYLGEKSTLITLDDRSRPCGKMLKNPSCENSKVMF